MSEQELDLKRSVRNVWRHKTIVGIFAALGLIAGISYAVVNPPMLSSNALVVLPPSVHDTRTQLAIASSDPVLAPVHRSIDTAISLEAMRRRVQARSPAYNLISISAQGTTAAQAERTANAVAHSYVRYVSSSAVPGRAVQAQVLSAATNATSTPLAIALLTAGGPGLLLGALIGAIVALGISRSDRRLRERDQIADCVGVPVLASVAVARPSSAAAWTTLLTEYLPGAVDAWRLRNALRHLDLADGNGCRPSLAVLSLSSDRKALALGPQLAAFTASLGISTALVIGPQQDPNVTATLRSACATPMPPNRPKNLRVCVSDDGHSEPGPEISLTVVVAVVDSQAPKVAETMRASATVLGVSAGAVTDEQLARVAASAASDGRHIAGILVADPDPADHTTGRLPQLLRPSHKRIPTRMTGRAMETAQ